MTEFTLFGTIITVASLLTLIRYFVKKSSSVLISFFQYFLAILFIFSGFIKANDPLGFSYKLEEYFEVFGTEWLIPFSLSISIFMCALEILLGLLLLVNAKIKITLTLLVLMILFFASLNFYSGYYDKVRECGCFGDALLLTPWQEFRNNIAMLAMAVFVFIKSSSIRPLLRKSAEKIFIVISVLICVGFPVFTYNFLPVKDFRPYAVGKNIQEGMKLPPGAKQDSIQMVFTYEKDGRQVELTPDQIKTIDTTYKYIDRKDKVIFEGDKPAIHDFSIVSTDGNDYTDQILNYNGYYFFLVMYDLDKTDKHVFGKINDFSKLCKQDKISVIALTASSDKIESFKKETGTDIDFYLTDGTTLKTMIRSNPGLMLMKHGTVIHKWHYHSFPTYSELKKNYFTK